MRNDAVLRNFFTKLPAIYEALMHDKTHEYATLFDSHLFFLSSVLVVELLIVKTTQKETIALIAIFLEVNC